MMKETTLLVSALTILFVVCETRNPEHKVENIESPTANRHSDLTFPPSETLPENVAYSGNSKSTHKYQTKPEETSNRDVHKLRHHHGSIPAGKPKESFKKRKGRCRRYSQRYYQPYQNVPMYVPNRNKPSYTAPNYIPPQYLVPTYYSSMCRSHCVPCITSTCRRRCPDFPGSSTAGTTAKITVTTTAVSKNSDKPTATITVVTKSPCNCNEDGSQSQTCNSTGACICKPNYTGITCDTCKDGYWKNINLECVKCDHCNEYGSIPKIYCDKKTGRCKCKEGVTGKYCDRCKPGYYGNVESGCKKCDPCNEAGHICNENGKCVCPPLSEGKNCEQCIEGAWDYKAGIGCKACQCSQSGSTNIQCDTNRGTCICKAGYEGKKCNKCSFGYYGYPNCQKCDCNISGTIDKNCRSGICSCTNNGSCHCKDNVEGKTCDTCKSKTFGLSNDNPKGCTACFCFGRSTKCTAAPLKWDKIRVDKINNETQSTTDYWMLPNKFLGDLTPSYGGYLTAILKEGYFFVRVKGNGVQLRTISTRTYDVQLVEDNWNITLTNPQFPSNCSKLSKPCFMAVLQNVTSILVEANNRIQEVLLDKAAPNLPTYLPSRTVEKCECPKEYTGLSCQDPNVGYFRYFSNDTNDNWIDKVIGKAKPCECNGRSQTCDPNTGFCENCSLNSSGKHCELCEVGFYKNDRGNCSACLCPSANENNAESCSPIGNDYKCNCKHGFTGQFCEKCDDGYLNKATTFNPLICEPCNCNPFGIVGRGICNEFGICHCKEGFKGEKCDECVNEREFIKNGVCTPCDECVKILFSEIDNLALAVEDTFNLFKDGLTPPWNNLTNTIDKHHMLSEKFKNKKEQAEKLLNGVNLDEIEKRINNMQKKLTQENDNVTQNIFNTYMLKNSTNSMKEEVEKIREKLIDVIENLDSFQATPLNVENALNRSKEILKQIQNISEKFNKQQDQEAIKFCTNISQKVNEIYKPPSNVPNQLLNDLQDKLNDITNISAVVERMSNKADKMNTKNSERILNFKKNLEKLKNIDINAKTSVEDLMEKINATNNVIDKLTIVYEDLKNITHSLELKQLEHRIRREMNDNSKLEDIFLKAIDHVQELENKINYYQSLFNFTKDEWKKINASGAYETIINGLKEAKNSAELSRHILENATKLINPTDSENILNKTNLANAFSDNLKKRINNLKDISQSLSDIKSKLDQFKYSIQKNGRANNDLNQILHKMELEITSQEDRVSKLEEAIKNSTNIIDVIKKIEKSVQDMLISSQEGFFNKYQIYLNLTSKEEIEKLGAKLNNTRKHLENLSINSTYFDAIKQFNNGIKNENLQAVQEKITNLKNKIRYAKQAADTINVALNVTHCRMVYKLPETEVLQSLSITFKCRTCQLLNVANSDGKLNLAVNNNDIILEFNDKTLVISGKEDKEKTINIQKLGSLIKMQVDTTEKSEVVDSPYFILHANDQIEIGSITNKSKKKAYVYNVVLNGKKFGLWNFFQTEGNCTGETRDETDRPDNVNAFFNGKGYNIYGKNTKLNPTKLTLGFDFSTFDENSLIYLASFDESVTNKEEDCSYIVLFLNNGYISLIVRHSNGQNSTLTLDNKSNNGSKQHVEITMEYEKSGVQHYTLYSKNETHENAKNITDNLNKKNVFKIKQATHYIGGTPPIFNKMCLPINITPFLGFLKLSTPLSNEILSYGVTGTAKKFLEYHKVRINKNGYVAIKLMEKTIDSISFILQPISSNGLIMNLTQYNISLKDGNLNIDGLKNDNNFILNTNDYNTVNISLKQGIIRVNKNEKIVQFPKAVYIENLIVTIGDKYEGFDGGLSSVLINEKELLFTPSSVTEFSNVEIGRDPPPVKSRINEKAVKSLSAFIPDQIQNIESCATLNYESVPNAVQFGDEMNSYIYIKSNFWKSDYKISFKFRTFFPNGVFFISAGTQKQQHYTLLRLTDGQLGLYNKGRKNKSPVILKDKLNDGHWHNIEILKRKRKLTIILDDKEKKTVKIPKTVVRNEIFLGGVPLNSDYTNIAGLGLLHPFKGCMRSVNINDENQLIKSKDVSLSNIRRCFLNIEEGAYFDGNTFATFKKKFKIKKSVKFSFEFRTTEQNGVLMSLTNPRNSSSLSIELQNGAVVMAVDVGNGIISNVKNNLGSDFRLCNNMWHNVTAMYTSELTLIVDGITQAWALSEINSLLGETLAPMYIGGLPENAPIGTLKTSKKFKGCIRNLRIEGKLIDWFDMEELNRVSLNSCPI